MARETYVWDAEKQAVVPKSEYRRLQRGSAPHVISDQVAPFQSMIDGETYDSKSVYGRSIREASARTGRDYQIVGNDVGHLTRDTPYEPRGVETALARTLQRLGC